MTLKSILTDLKQRILKLETLHAVYKLPLGYLLAAVSWAYLPYWQAAFHINFLINDMGLAIGVKHIAEAIAHIFHNPVKAQNTLSTAVAQKVNGGAGAVIPPQ